MGDASPSVCRFLLRTISREFWASLTVASEREEKNKTSGSDCTVKIICEQAAEWCFENVHDADIPMGAIQ